MLYEYRISECVQDKKEIVHKRNRDVTRHIYTDLGIDYVGAWEAITGNSSHIHYFLRWSSLDERQEKWPAFLADPRFLEAAKQTTKNGPLTRRVPNEIWGATAYSPILK